MRCSRQAGLTLIEVLAAIAILGTILVGIVVAKARHTRQIALTARRNVAVRAADEMITRWWASKEGIPIGQSGTVAADETLSWETRQVANPAIEALGTHVVRLEIHDKGATDQPLVVVELLPPEPGQEKERKVE